MAHSTAGNPLWKQQSHSIVHHTTCWNNSSKHWSVPFFRKLSSCFPPSPFTYTVQSFTAWVPVKPGELFSICKHHMVLLLCEMPGFCYLSWPAPCPLFLPFWFSASLYKHLRPCESWKLKTHLWSHRSDRGVTQSEGGGRGEGRGARVGLMWRASSELQGSERKERGGGGLGFRQERAERWGVDLPESSRSSLCAALPPLFFFCFLARARKVRGFLRGGGGSTTRTTAAPLHTHWEGNELLYFFLHTHMLVTFWIMKSGLIIHYLKLHLR